MYKVYILYSQKLNRFYIGYTSINVEGRLKKHLADHNGYTSRAKDWIICLTESYETKQEAMFREQQIKNWKSQQRVTELIQRSSTKLSTLTFMLGRFQV